MLIRSRRDFMRDVVRSVSAAGALGALGKFGEMNALAATGNYQALVCVYLAGGNDGHNTVIPIQTGIQGANYSTYAAGRSFMALPQAGLKVINNGSDVYALHSKMPEIQALYNAGSAAVVANVGMLVKPTDRNSYNAPGNSAVLPSALFSHSDQSGQWQTANATGLASTGWGGGLADYMASLNQGAAFPAATSTSGASLFCTGQSTFPASVPPGGTPILTTSQYATSGLQQLLTFDNGMQLVQAANGNTKRGVNYATLLTNALASVTINTPFPMGTPDTPNQLSPQLLTVAKMIKAQATLGLSRQIFFCQLGGFDTHGAQLAVQDSLLQQLSQAVGAFQTAMQQELAMDKQVTLFTASEFGRTLTPNSNTGTDHAWGNHHFVVGGAVQGGKFYGQFPTLSLGSLVDANQRGTLIPTTSVDQYAATMAKWFGVPAAQLGRLFPNRVATFGGQTLGVLG